MRYNYSAAEHAPLGKRGGMKMLRPGKNKKQNRHSVLMQFSISYIAIITVPIIIATVNYRYILNMTSNQIFNSYNLILKNADESLENSIDSISVFIDVLNKQGFLDTVLKSSDLDEIKISDLQYLIANLPDFSDINRYVKSYYICGKRSGIIIQSNRIMLNPELYYENVLQVPDHSYRQWMEKVFDFKNLIGFINAGSRLFYHVPYSDRNTGQIISQVVFEIDRARMESELAPALDLGAKHISVLDSNQNRLLDISADGEAFPGEPASSAAMGAQEAFRRTIAGEDMQIINHKSADYGLTYVVATLRSVFVKEAIKNLQVTLFILAALTTVCVAFIFLSYRYNKKPLLRLSQEISIPDMPASQSIRQRARNGLWLISNKVSALNESHAALEVKISEQRRWLKESFLIKFVYGALLDKEYSLQTVEEHSINLQGYGYRGLYIALTGEIGEASEELRAFIADRIDEGTPNLTPCFWSDERHLALLYRKNDNLGMSCEAALTGLYFDLKSNLGIEAMFFVGTETDLLAEVPSSFAEARKLLMRDHKLPTNIIVSADVGDSENCIYEYSLSSERNLLELAESGDYEAIQAKLGQIYKRNFCDRSLSPLMGELLLSRMGGTLIASKWNSGFDWGVLTRQEQSVDDFFVQLKKAYRKICEKAVAQRKEECLQIQKNLLDYLNQNFHKQSMCLSELSARFGMTESYISTLVKQLVGIPFSNYLETLRIAKANELLNNRKRSISEVGYQVGYDSATSFGRAYKRAMGFPPSQYLERQTRSANAGDAANSNNSDGEDGPSKKE
jgi:AraC-like DNA-binding protein